MSEDRAETYARTKVKEIQEKEFIGMQMRWADIQDAIAQAVRYGQALGPHREPENPNPNWHPGMGGASIR